MCGRVQLAPPPTPFLPAAVLAKDVWHDKDVRRLLRPGVKAEGQLSPSNSGRRGGVLQLFEVHKQLSVLVAPGSRWLVREEVQAPAMVAGDRGGDNGDGGGGRPRDCDMGRDWIPMSAANGLPTNSYRYNTTLPTPVLTRG